MAILLHRFHTLILKEGYFSPRKPIPLVTDYGQLFRNVDFYYILGFALCLNIFRSKNVLTSFLMNSLVKYTA